MLFNSYVFIFAFLPIVFAVFFFVGKRSHALAIAWLAFSSLFFYAWWNVYFVGLLLCSIIFNYAAGYLIGKCITSGAKRLQKIILTGAVIGDLGLLGYFKYANFFIENLATFTGMSFSITNSVLPIGISFFTFTQIAFLVDAHHGQVREYKFLHYLLFVTYFPHLIAGPILHHKEMMPQFAQDRVCRIDEKKVGIGLTIFVLGLAKKVLIADSLASLATPMFDMVKAGGHPVFFEAWVGALAYTLQLYFDFSAYSEMAIGLSLMFNVRLPLNFNSPYKAASIIDFWGRWHMTLSRFLREYLYIPLGGSRKGTVRRFMNLVITMLLGGLWHGAGWPFIVWGALHGFYLVVNHGWRDLKQNMKWKNGGRLADFSSRSLTFLAVVIGWQFFRADSVTSAMAIIEGMIGLNGAELRYAVIRGGLVKLIPCLICVFFLPNIPQIMANHKIVLGASSVMEISREQRRTVGLWRPTAIYALLMGMLFIVCVYELNKASEFLYFQF